MNPHIANRTETLEKVAEEASTFRLSIPKSPEQSLRDAFAVVIERKDRQISRLEQELETERRENSRLRLRLEKVGNDA